MKKILSALLFCLILTGCAAPQKTGGSLPGIPEATVPKPTWSERPALAETTAPVGDTPETAPVEHFVTLYAPNEDVTGFIYASIEVSELSADAICNALIGAGVLKGDVKFNRLTVENGQVNLDVNAAFGRQLMSYGTAGEYMMMGSVVNTLLSAYGAKTVYITMDGQTMESGHVIYDFPQEFYKDQTSEQTSPAPEILERTPNFDCLVYISSISDEALVFDEVEFVVITSRRAEELGITPENTPGTFYLYNEAVVKEEYPIALDCICRVFDWNDGYVPRDMSAGTFARTFTQRNTTQPYSITVENGIVTKIVEEFLS